MPPAESSPAALELCLANERAELERLQRALDAWLANQALGERAVADTRLVAEELVANVISHAFPRGGRHEIHLTVTLEPDDVLVRVVDEGEPFDPFAAEPAPRPRRLAEAPIGGRGLRLVRSVIRAGSYRRDGQRNGVEVRIPRR